VQVQDEGRLITTQTDNAVAIKIRNALRLTKAIHIRERRVGMIMNGEQAPLDQIRLSWAPQPDRHIRFPHGKVEFVVCKNQLNVHFGISVEKFGDALGKPNSANPDSRRDLEVASGSVAGFRETLARRLKPQMHIAGRSMEHITMFGQDEAAGMAMEEWNFQIALERADLTAH
jgi:hypothetical protein